MIIRCGVVFMKRKYMESNDIHNKYILKKLKITI